MNKRKIQEIIRTSKFDPKFTPVTTLHQVADYINRPHEDYPKRVPATREMIEMFSLRTINENDSYNPDGFVESDILYIHNKVMPELYEYDTASKYRTIMVYPSGGDKNTYYDPIRIQDGMNDILPLKSTEVTSNQDLIDWYHAFQIIHPFKDGNGRVGGIVVATVSKFLFGKYLAPHQ